MKKQAAKRVGCRPQKNRMEVHTSATKFLVNGKEVTKEEWDAIPPNPVDAGVKPGDPWQGGMWSDGFGCDPAEIARRQKDLKEVHGIETEYHPETGQAKIRNREHRTKMLKAHNYVDYSGGYKETYNHETIDPAAGLSDSHLSDGFKVEPGNE